MQAASNRNMFLVIMLFAALAAPAMGQVPAELADPDGKAGDASQPVQVYILAGQSNMVGMGDLAGAKNMFNGIYLTSDPAASKGPLGVYKVGNYLIAPLAIYQLDGVATENPITEGQLEVEQKGVYQFHCGSGANSYNVMNLDGKEVYRRESGGASIKQEVTLEAGKRYSFKITGFQGDPPRFWMQRMDLLGNGDLESVAKRDGKFPWLVDNEGNWTVRSDVYFQEARIAENGKGSPLSATSNGKSIGPELGFGHVMGNFHDEQVLLIKTSMGNRSLGFDYRPPSSGRTDPNNEWESLEYKLMIEGVRKTLDNIDKVVPGYQGQGYELAGFLWWQGHKDGGASEDYEQNLVNLINDVRSEFKVPKLPAVVATVGFGGHNMNPKYLDILESQMAVGDAEKHPEYAGTVASVDTRDFWREVDESPRNQDYHYNRNAETYMLVGDALGRAMVGLRGGTAEPLPPTRRPKRAAPQVTQASQDDLAAAQVALKPIVLDGIAQDYIANPRYHAALVKEANSQRPERANQFLFDAMYGLENCYRAVGVHDFDWLDFGPDLRHAQWDYFSFDPHEPASKSGERYRKISLPPGMDDWTAVDFDAAKTGWKKGQSPFGQLAGKLAPLRQSCNNPDCGCGETPNTLWEQEALLMRGTFEFPQLKEDHRYRIVVGGSAHVNTGEGYAIFINGKPLAESNRGVANRQGGQPRGSLIFNEFRDEFSKGPVTIAVKSFLRFDSPESGSGHLSVWLEEQKVPPLE